jgi:hypothetical protein
LFTTSGERFALDVFCYDEQWAARLRYRFQERQQRLQSGELLFVDQDVGLIEIDTHLLGISNEIR